MWSNNMSWNEPGDKKDPWSGRGDQKGPPDLDEVIRSLQEKLGNLFGGGSGGSNGGENGGEQGHGSFEAAMKNIGLIVAGGLFLWGLSGFYIVDEGNHGVETRFGKWVKTTQSGLNWHLPAPIEQVAIVNVKQQRYIEVGYRSVGGDQSVGSVPKEALMLTKDENIVDIRLAVQYQVKDAKEYLFNIVNPTSTLKQVIESVQRGVIGASTMDFVLTEGRSEVVTQIKKEIQDVMDSYKAGIQITSVNLQDAQAPEQVQNAYQDAIKAREDEQRLINEAQAYANDVVPKARGLAARKLQEAEGYREQVIARAEGESNRFTKLLAEYVKAPDVTRKRLYIEAMEGVFSETNTMMIDVKGANNMLYLPLDKLNPVPQTAQEASSNATPTEQTSAAVTEEKVDPALRTSIRGREARGR
jgi:membrane protease subunit HflK